MSKQHNDQDKDNRLSNQQPYNRDKFQTIEFTEEEKQILRRPNRQPIDEDYFAQTEMSQDDTDHLDSNSRVDEVEEPKTTESSDVNEFRYTPLKERLKEQEMNAPKEEKKPKQKKKLLGDFFKPTFEERYDLTELEDITDYNQFNNESNQPTDSDLEDYEDFRMDDESSTKKKPFLSSVKDLFFSSSKDDDQSDTTFEDEADNQAFEESVNQTDWLHQDDFSEELLTDDERLPHYEDLADEEEQYETESASDLDDVHVENHAQSQDEDELESQVYPDESGIDEDYELTDQDDENSDIDEQFKDKNLSEEELDELSIKISQDTESIQNPILTDQVLNEYYQQQNAQVEEEKADQTVVDEDKSGITSGASWLTIGNVLSRIIGALYVIPWATWLGAEYTQANTLYSAGYKPYSLMLAIATAGFPSSIAKQMAYYHSLKEYRTADKLFKNSIIIMLITGVISGGLLFFMAPILAANTSTTNVEGATLVIRSLAPALLILPVMSLLRGYFQGFNDMKPTAISQIIEQFARVGYLLAATYAVMMIYSGEVTTAVVHSTFAAFIGALGSLLYLLFEYARRLPVAKRLIARSKDNISLTFNESIKVMVIDSIPFILLGSGIIIAQLIDTYTFGQILESTSALLLTEIEELYGVLSLDVDKLVMIIISLAVALASSLVPVISRMFAQRRIESTSELVEHITVLFSIVMIPAALGMAAIANNIYFLFYPNGSETGPNLLITAAISSIVLGAYTVFSTILQSMNYRRLAVRFLLVGIIVKAILQFPSVALLQAHGALISTAIGFLVSTILMWLKLSKELEFNYRRLSSSLIKILVGSILMTISAVMWNESLNLLFGPVGRGLTFLKILIVIFMAVLTYGSILGITNMLSVLIGNRYKDIQDKMRLM